MKMNTRVLAGITTLAALVVVFDYTVKHPNFAQEKSVETRMRRKFKRFG